MGASLLVFKNKSDVPGCMSEEDIREVSTEISPPRKANVALDFHRDCNWTPFAPTNGTFCLAQP